MKKNFKEKQKKSKGSKAIRLQVFENSENNYFINVKGFLGYVESKIKVPGHIFYENEKKNVPIYLISAHGEMFGGLRLSRHSFEKKIPIVEETRNKHLFNRTKENQYVVNTAPIRSLICPSKFDGPFFKYLTENSQKIGRENFQEACNDVGYFERFTPQERTNLNVQHNPPSSHLLYKDRSTLLNEKSDLKNLYLSRDELQSKFQPITLTQDELFNKMSK